MTKENNERLGVLENKVDNLDKKLDVIAKESKDFHTELLEKMDRDMVTRAEFTPVQKIVYGMVGLILTSVALALLALIVQGGIA